MVYQRKRTSVTGGVRKRRRTTLARLVNPRPKSSVSALAKQVQSLSRFVKRDQQYINFGSYWSAQNLSSNYVALHLNRFDTWNYIFGSAANDTYQNSMIWKSTGLDMKFTIGNEMANTNFTVFLLQAKDEAATLIDSNGALTLTSTDAYYQTAALTMVNKKYFRILGIRRFSLGNNGQSASSSTAQTQFGTDRRMYMKFRPGKKITNPTGDWKALSRSLDPSGNYYLVIFNDNSAADLEYPEVTMTAVHTVQTM